MGVPGGMGVPFTCMHICICTCMLKIHVYKLQITDMFIMINVCGHVNVCMHVCIHA